jgi:hypothetical protein
MALDVGAGSLMSAAVPVPAVDAGASSAPRPSSSVLFGDGETLKRDLVAWAKAVASMAREISAAHTQHLPC